MSCELICFNERQVMIHFSKATFSEISFQFLQTYEWNFLGTPLEFKSITKNTLIRKMVLGRACGIHYKQLATYIILDTTWCFLLSLVNLSSIYKISVEYTKSQASDTWRYKSSVERKCTYTNISRYLFMKNKSSCHFYCLICLEMEDLY